MIRTVAWAVQPSSQNLNRPRKLVEELKQLDVIGEANYVYHGRTPPQLGHTRAPSLKPNLILSRFRNTAVLSPLFLSPKMSSVVWVDLYDDWSLAPDIHPINRAIAHAGYRQIKAGLESRQFPVTVNSAYMARKIGGGAIVVPNGVDENLWTHETTGTSANRLIILGHFFSGRTDFALIDRVVRTEVFDEIIIGGLGADKEARNLVRTLQNDLPGRIFLKDWITPRELAGHIGDNTVALVPNVVSDYTLSQDLMKAYTFLGLGIGVICPRMLWPAHLPIDDVYLVGHGDKLSAHLRSWVAQRKSAGDRRQEFCTENSWARRAQRIAEVIK